MLRLWGFARGITIQTMGDNLFLFQFSDEFERERVFQGSPWLFDNYLLALNAFDGSCPIHQIRFTHSCFGVQLHGVPLYYMTKETGERNPGGECDSNRFGGGCSGKWDWLGAIVASSPLFGHYKTPSMGPVDHVPFSWPDVARLRASSLGGGLPDQYGLPTQTAIPAGKSPTVNLHARFAGGGSDSSTPLSNLTNARDSVGSVPKYPQQHEDIGECVKVDLKLPEDSGIPLLPVNNLDDKDGSAIKVDWVATQGGAVLKDMFHRTKVMHEMGELHDTSVSSGVVEVGPHSTPLVSHQGLSEDKGTSPLKKSWKRLARCGGCGAALAATNEATQVGTVSMVMLKLTRERNPRIALCGFAWEISTKFWITERLWGSEFDLCGSSKIFVWQWFFVIFMIWGTKAICILGVDTGGKILRP
uniref:DUF4283 domain-containing protein n=1 Tax=Fagus sylvatica TaxID=28930 RepID=A0A2N9G564_FAGSY